jgi:hypothetical protein
VAVADHKFCGVRTCSIVLQLPLQKFQPAKTAQVARYSHSHSCTGSEEAEVNRPKYVWATVGECGGLHGHGQPSLATLFSLHSRSITDESST